MCLMSSVWLDTGGLIKDLHHSLLCNISNTSFIEGISERNHLAYSHMQHLLVYVVNTTKLLNSNHT